MRAFKIISLTVIAFIMATSCMASKVENNTSSPGNRKMVSLEEGKGGSKTDLGVEGKDYVAGEVLVKFKKDISREAVEKIAKDSGLEIIRVVSPPNLYLLKIAGDSTVKDTIKLLKEFEEVEYSEPNYIYRINK